MPNVLKHTFIPKTVLNFLACLSEPHINLHITNNHVHACDNNNVSSFSINNDDLLFRASSPIGTGRNTTSPTISSTPEFLAVGTPTSNIFLFQNDGSLNRGCFHLCEQSVYLRKILAISKHCDFTLTLKQIRHKAVAHKTACTSTPLMDLANHLYHDSFRSLNHNTRQSLIQLCYYAMAVRDLVCSILKTQVCLTLILTSSTR